MKKANRGPAAAQKAQENKISVAFLEAIAADFEEHGAGIIAVVRAEKAGRIFEGLGALSQRMLFSE